jgi:hypothetical protein
MPEAPGAMRGWEFAKPDAWAFSRWVITSVLSADPIGAAYLADAIHGRRSIGLRGVVV